MADTPATPAPQSTPGNGPGGGQQSGDGNATPPAPPQQPATPSETPPAAPSQPADTQPSEQPGQQSLDNASPEQMRQIITNLRAENARDRTTARDNAAQQARDEVVQSIGQALGLVDGDNTPDAEQLTSQLTEQTNTAKQAQLELAVYKAAADPDLGADAAALLDSRSFLEKVAELDPTKTDDITSAIKEAVKDNPRLQNEQGQVPPKRSSNQMNQQNRTPVAETPADLAALIPRQF